ncbi:MAG: hypothetical protein IIV14_03880, partial [Bacteroidaceae bacterium]|nr:hypothetical protein [Bacteroidaceae bacterium]
FFSFYLTEQRQRLTIVKIAWAVFSHSFTLHFLFADSLSRAESVPICRFFRFYTVPLSKSNV